MKKLTNQYYIIYELDEKKRYIASVPAIPGCVVYGKTLKEAYKNISSAIKECLEVFHEFNKELPKETIKPDAVKQFSFVRVPFYAEA